MSYTREQRAANAAKAATAAAKETPALEPSEGPSKVDRPSPKNEPRRRAMEEIEARDLQSKGIEPEKPEPKAEPAPEPKVEPKAEEAPTHQDAPVESVEAVVEPPKRVKVKVDGVESEVSQSEIDDAGGVSAYQRQQAADNRLKKSNEALAEVRKTQAAMAKWIQDQQPKQPTLTDDQFIQSKMDIIRYGEPAEASRAMAEVIGRQNKQVDPNLIVQNVQMKIHQGMAVDNFKKEFHDVVSNPMLYKLASTLEHERIPHLKPGSDMNEFYRKIGNEVRSVVGRPSQPQTPAVVTTPDSTSQASDKEARKASIVNLPSASARAALPQESKPESREDILNSYKKSRGIQTG